MKTIFTLLFALTTFSLVAQPNSVVPKNIRAANTLDRLFDANGLASFDDLYGIPLEPGRVVGTTYLNDNWKRTTIMLYDLEKMIQGYDVRYEIARDEIEIKTNNGAKVLAGKRVKSFVSVDSVTKAPHYYVNARDYKSDENVVFSGFFEVLAEGPLTLLSKTDIVVKDPTYDQRLDVGQRDTRIIKKTSFYYLENNLVRELPSSKRKLLPVFGQSAGAAEEFIKLNRLSLDEPGHLRALFEHYNGRVVTN